VLSAISPLKKEVGVRLLELADLDPVAELGVRIDVGESGSIRDHDRVLD
jgi:hypothetical protein